MRDIRILLVEDDPAARVALGAWLERQGARVFSAAGPGEADKVLACEAVEIVLSDVQMPGNAELAWIRRIVARPAAPAVVLLTGHPDLETALRAANLPLAGFLLKPPDHGALAALLVRVQRQHARRKAAGDLLAELSRVLAPAGATEGAAGPAADELRRLRDLLALAAAPDGSVRDGEDPVLAALADAVAVIERTKNSFRSRELGQLRARLQRVLAEAQAAERSEPASR